MARELTKAGLTVVGLERGAEKSPREDFALPRIRDELKYRVRQELMLDTAIETHTLRNSPSELALPMRKWDIPPVGDGLGGAGAHWNGVTWRFLPSEFVLRSHLTERYGRNAIPQDMTIQDWGISYDDTMIISSACAAPQARQAICAARGLRAAISLKAHAATNIRTSPSLCRKPG
jgi:gluconate 2-dehydrogenase alpha chain